MSETQKYLQAVQNAISDAKKSPFGFGLLTSSPGKDQPVDDDFSVWRDVGGIITIDADETLYRELQPELEKLMRRVLGITPKNGRIQVRFHHH